MADTHQDDDIPLSSMMDEARALDQAIAEAQDQLSEMTASAADVDAVAAATRDATIYEVPGIGRYAIASTPGWKPLLALLRDPSIDINFSLAKYPSFDAIVSETARSDHLDNPEDDQYDIATWRHLRDNIAAVRNFLMEVYYARTPAGMTQEQARQSMEQIAAFVGEGIANNYRLMGMIGNHDPSKPFIDYKRAARPDGEGAHYLYEEILKQQRQSSWMRPFSAITALFGGSKLVDWMLPADMPFSGPYDSTLPQAEGDAALLAKLNNMRGERAALQQHMEETAQIIDLESLGNQLVHTADATMRPVAELSQPVQDEAIRIAKDILEKLKIKLGSKNAIDGLNMKPGDDIATLGAVSGSAHVFERLLAWARGIDPSIAQHPSIRAATSAVGQLGYLAQAEALQLAHAIGNRAMAERIGNRLQQLSAYRPATGTSFGDLFDRLKGGIDTVLQMKTITGPGAAVGHTPNKDLGSYMSAAPIAGQAMQTTTDGTNRNAAGKINAELLRSAEAASQAQANRINSQVSQRNSQNNAGTTQSTTRSNSSTTPSRSASRGSQALAQARRTQSSSSSVSAASLAQANLSAAQRSAIQRSAAMRALQLHHDDHHEDHHPHAPQQMNRMHQLVNADMLKSMKAAMHKDMTGAPVATSAASYKALLAQGKVAQSMYGKPIKVDAPKPATTDEKTRHELIPVPPTPHKGGHSR